VTTIENDLVEVGKLDELKSGGMKMVMVQGRELLLARVGDQYYVSNNRCPHMGGKLSQGKMEGTIVTCPSHFSQFDIKDGRVVRWTNWPGALSALDRVRSHRRPLTVYPVVKEGNKIMVKLIRLE
jgi:3-phenylpropionate/trans-cinnamate dioxygenase ferredoxin subunit